MIESDFYIDFQKFVENNEIKELKKEEIQFLLYRLIFLVFLDESNYFNNTTKILEITYEKCKMIEIDFMQEIIKPIFFKLCKNVDPHFSNSITNEFSIFVNYLGEIFPIEDFEKFNNEIITNNFWDNFFNFVNKFSWNIDEYIENIEIITPKIYEYIYERVSFNSGGKTRMRFGMELRLFL